MEIELSGKNSIKILFIFLAVIYIYFAYNTTFLGEDEWIYMKIARDFDSLKWNIFDAQGLPASYPPLISLIYAIPFLVSGVNLAIAKIIIALFGVGIVCLIYLTSLKIDSTSLKGFSIFGLASISILLSISSFTHYMQLAYVEIPIAFFSLLFLYAFLFKFNKLKDAVFLGVIMGISFYMKLSAIFLPIVLFIFAVLMFLLKKDKKTLKLSAIAIIVSVLVVSPWIVRNLILYGYPFVEGLNLFFKLPPTYPEWVTEASQTLSVPVDMFSTFSLISILFAVFSVVYCILAKDMKLSMPILMLVVFLLVYYLRFSIGSGISDPRYFSIIFPQIALIGGYFLPKLYNDKKYFAILLVAIIIFSFYVSLATAYQTSSYQRYPDNYISALTELKKISKPDDIVFTTYGGSLGYFADRQNIWTIKEFPEVMTTTDSSYIYNTLRDYNISYILVWRGVVAQNYIVPESNLIGAFTPTFINAVDGDKGRFETVYTNEDNIVWRLNTSYVV